MGTLTSWNPLGHSRPVTGLLYLYLRCYWCIGCGTKSYSPPYTNCGYWIKRVVLKKYFIFKLFYLQSFLINSKIHIATQEAFRSLTSWSSLSMVFCVGLPFSPFELRNKLQVSAAVLFGFAMNTMFRPVSFFIKRVCLKRTAYKNFVTVQSVNVTKHDVTRKWWKFEL
jgi:hypothetical protein